MKLTRRSINLLIIANLIICYLTQMHLAVRSDSPFNNLHRFMQKATTKTGTITHKNSSSDKITSKVHIFYDVDIFTIKGNDPIGYKYNPYTTKLSLNKNIDFYQEGKVVRELPFTSFMFLDGVIIFDDLSFFLKVKTKDYMDIMNTFRPRIEKFAFTYDKDKFNKYCFFIINHTWISNEEKDKGKEFSVMIFCLNSETTEKEMLERFPEDFRKKYTNSLVESEDFLSLQQYRIKQNIQIQFYEAHITLEEIQKQSHATGQASATGGLPTLYTSFSNEGLVMNLDPNHDPTKVRYSFRYDQVIKCRGEHPPELKKFIKSEITSLFRPDECCVSYVVDFNNTCSMAMFCSTYLKEWKCRADIKIFRSTLYKRCVIEKTENIDKKIDRITKDVKGEKETFLSKAAIIFGLRETMDKKMMDSLDANSTLGRILTTMGTKNKTYEAAVLATLKPDCINVFKRIEAKEQRNKNNKTQRGPEMGLDLGSKVEEELKYSPGMLSASKVEGLQMELCEEYKKLEELEKNNKDANGNNPNNNTNNGENGGTPNGNNNGGDNSNNNNANNPNQTANQNGGMNPSGSEESGNANSNQPFNNQNFNQNGNNSNPFNPNNPNGNGFNNADSTNPNSPMNNGNNSSPDPRSNWNGNLPNGSGSNPSNNYPNGNNPSFDGVNNKPDAYNNGPNGNNGPQGNNPNNGGYADGNNSANPSGINNQNPYDSANSGSPLGNKGNAYNPLGNSNSPLNGNGGDYMNPKNRNSLNPHNNRNSGFKNSNYIGSKGIPTNSQNPFENTNPFGNQSGNNHNPGPNYDPNSVIGTPNNGNSIPNSYNNASGNPNSSNDPERNPNPNNNDPNINDRNAGFNNPNNVDAGQISDNLAKGPLGNLGRNPGLRNNNDPNSPFNNASGNPINSNGLNGDINNPALGNNKGFANNRGRSNGNPNNNGRGSPNNNNSENPGNLNLNSNVPDAGGAYDPRNKLNVDNKNKNNGNSDNSMNNGDNDNSQNNFNGEKPNMNKKADFVKNMDKIKTDLEKANLDPKYFDKLVLMVNRYPDIKNTLINNPHALSQFKPEELMKLGESTPEDSVRLLRQMTEDHKKLFIFKKDQFKNKFSILPSKKEKRSNKVKGPRYTKTDFDTDKENKDDGDSISPLEKDVFGNPIKLNDNNDQLTDLPKDVRTQYTDDSDNRPENDTNSSKDVKNKIKIPVFDESRNKNKSKENENNEYKNPIDEAVSNVDPSAKPEDLLNLDFQEKTTDKKSVEKAEGKTKQKKQSAAGDKDDNSNENEKSDSQEKSSSNKDSNKPKKNSKKDSDKTKGSKKKNDSSNVNSENDASLDPPSADKDIAKKSDSDSNKDDDITKEQSEKQGKEETGNNSSSEKNGKSAKKDSKAKKSDTKDSSNKFKNNKTKGGESNLNSSSDNGMNGGNINISNNSINQMGNQNEKMNNKETENFGNNYENSTPRKNNNLKKGKSDKDAKLDKSLDNLEYDLENGDANGKRQSTNSTNKGNNIKPGSKNPNKSERNNKDLGNSNNTTNNNGGRITDGIKSKGNNNAAPNDKHGVPVFSMSTSEQNKNQKPEKTGMIQKNFLSEDDGSKVIQIVDSINLE